MAVINDNNNFAPSVFFIGSYAPSENTSTQNNPL